MMLIKMAIQPALTIGARFYQYLPKRNFAYCSGVVKSVTEEIVAVDFGDMIISFNRNEVSYIINPELGDEHFMSIKTGIIIADYRKASIGNMNEADGSRGTSGASGSKG